MIILRILALVLPFAQAGVFAPDLATGPNDPLAGVASETIVRLVHANGKMFCSGTLISPTEVVTASHCFGDIPVEDARVEVVQNGQIVKRLYVADIRRSVHGDAAVVKLPTDLVPPTTQFPEIADSCDPGAPIYSVGYGLSAKGAFGHPKNARVSRYDQVKESSEDYVGRAKLKTGHMCEGDSGGPALCKHLGKMALVGVNRAMNWHGAGELIGALVSAPLDPVIPVSCMILNVGEFTNLHGITDLENMRRSLNVPSGSGSADTTAAFR